MADADAECVSHTPGPWRQSQGGYIHGSDCIVAKVGSFEDAELAPQSGARWIADANLIAAAPDLYEYVESSASAGCATAKALIAKIEGRDV